MLSEQDSQGAGCTRAGLKQTKTSRAFLRGLSLLPPSLAEQVWHTARRGSLKPGACTMGIRLWNLALVWVSGKDIKLIPFHPHHGQGHFPQAQVVPNPVQPSLGHFPGWEPKAAPFPFPPQCKCPLQPMSTGLVTTPCPPAVPLCPLIGQG